MRYVTLNEDNKVISIRHGKAPVEGEIQSGTGELGQIMQEDGAFVDAPDEPVNSQPTLEDKINFLYYKGMGVI